ncbi:formate dehydrogenase accessory protein FdhE [Desulforamulus aquiferis]|uniref:Formate dehydrogenase accessory protein FdhE n=2 Tax=Desulforamulus aquiferis TaxID=1397668 RepID=A0AAW7ZBK4_9FIRM|nr:formate dehydrogenase accessory protein FdhE [Desulforamulus aquiferis]
MNLEKDTQSLDLWVSFDTEQIKEWSQGKAALAVAPPGIESERLFMHLCAVAKACQKWQVGPQPVTNNYINSIEELSKPQRQEFITSLFLVEGSMLKWSKYLNVPADLLEYIAYNTFKPVVKTYAEIVLGQIQISDWTHGYCPVCGSQPSIAKLAGKDGHRRLYCGRCEIDWRYKRLGCPHCDDNASQASFITLDNYKQYRIYLCDRCKSYLKTVDERISGEVDLFCEDLATAELDKIAQAEGFQRSHSRQWV